MSRLPQQDWVDEEAVADALSPPDPLRSLFARNRSRRGGQPDPPLEIVSATQGSAEVGPIVSETKTLFSPDLLFAANRELSGAALKVLVVALERGPVQSISLSQFMQAARLSKNTVIAGIRECMDWGWMTRKQACPRCLTPLPEGEGEKVSDCHTCARQVAPQACYTVQNPNRVVQNVNSPVEYTNSPVQEPDSPPVQEMRSPVQSLNSHPVQDVDSLPVQNLNRYTERMQALTSQNSSVPSTYPVQNMNSPVQEPDSPPVQNVNSSRARGDSESPNRISDSRFPVKPESKETGRVVYGSQGWQQMTERLAKDSARRIGDKSIGFHVKCWAHARKLDWENGGRRCEEGLLAIAQELEGKNNAPGKSQGRGQGALWTKMVRRYFEEKGHPLLTEAEIEEWKDVHGSYQPPQL